MPEEYLSEASQADFLELSCSVVFVFQMGQWVLLFLFGAFCEIGSLGLGLNVCLVS